MNNSSATAATAFMVIHTYESDLNGVCDTVAVCATREAAETMCADLRAQDAVNEVAYTAYEEVWAWGWPLTPYPAGFAGMPWQNRKTGAWATEEAPSGVANDSSYRVKEVPYHS